MPVLSEIGQCTCGIIFGEGIDSSDFIDHLTDRTHQRCLDIEVCGPCFIGVCTYCERSRRSEVQRWKCRCMHDMPVATGEVVSVLSVKQLWSDWLEAGRPSSVSLGIEDIPTEGETYVP